MNKLVLVLLVLVGAVAVISQDFQSHIYCGRHLATTMEWLCNSELVAKRGGSAAWWRLSETRGKRGGLASECCEKPCSIDVMISYC